MRPTVKWFATQMEMELRKHDHIKGSDGWRAESKSYLLKELLENVGMLVYFAGKVHKPSEAIRECTDIANLAMMIADNYGDPKK